MNFYAKTKNSAPKKKNGKKKVLIIRKIKEKNERFLKGKKIKDFFFSIIKWDCLSVFKILWTCRIVECIDNIHIPLMIHSFHTMPTHIQSTPISTEQWMH